MAGANPPSCGINSSIKDGCFWLDGTMAAPYVTFLTGGGNADRKPNSGRLVLTAALNYGCQVSRSIIAGAAQLHLSVIATSPGIPPGKSMISTLSLYPRGRKYFAQS